MYSTNTNSKYNMDTLNMIYIEGNIGAGKSTFLQLFEEYLEQKLPDSSVLPEPVKAWENMKDSSGKNILEHYYSDQKKYGFTFQMNAFISRVQEIEEMRKQKKMYNFVERSVYTDKNVFTLTNYKNGNINEIELNVYLQWFNVFTEKFNLKPNAYIYLKTDAETCATRIRRRDRTGESAIPLEYLKELSILHDTWLADEKQSGIPILEVDVSVDYISDTEASRKIFQEIIDFVQNC